MTHPSFFNLESTVSPVAADQVNHINWNLVLQAPNFNLWTPSLIFKDHISQLQASFTTAVQCWKHSSNVKMWSMNYVPIKHLKEWHLENTHALVMKMKIMYHKCVTENEFTTCESEVKKCFMGWKEEMLWRVEHSCKYRTWEVEARGLRVWGHKIIVSKIQTNKSLDSGGAHL